MTTLLQLAQSYTDPESHGYKLAWQKAYLDDLLGDKDFGDLAFEDQVQLAMLGDTVIQGGYLRTELIKAGSISAEHLSVDDLAAISGRFSGNVYVGGDLLVGGQGVLSVLKYESMGQGSFSETDGWSNLGIIAGPTNYAGRLTLVVAVPLNLNITKATLTLYAMPTFYYNPDFPDYPPGHETKWKQSRNLKLYYSDGLDGFWYTQEATGITQVAWRGGTDVTQAIFGVATWSPTLAYSGNNASNTQNKIQARSGDIKNYLEPGKSVAFYVETTDIPTYTNFKNNQGLGKMIVMVEGYVRPV